MSRIARLRPGLPVAAALGIGLLVGALALGDDGPTGNPGDPVVERVSFQADRGVREETILEMGGLTIKGSCRASAGVPYLSVAAETAEDDAVISVGFNQRNRQDQSAYQFGLSDFDRSYGAWDFLGNSPDNTAGNLNYSRPDGGQVSVTFVADQQTAQGECMFGGTAVLTP